LLTACCEQLLDPAAIRLVIRVPTHKRGRARREARREASEETPARVSSAEAMAAQPEAFSEENSYALGAVQRAERLRARGQHFGQHFAP
jgi:hypothetical protein